MKRADNGFEKDYESNMHAEREVLHAVYPRKDYQPWRIDAKGKKWASDWVYRQGGKILEANGPIIEDMSRSMEPPLVEMGEQICRALRVASDLLADPLT
jgi:hypothetical protein